MGGDGRRGPVAREAALIAVALVACAGVACAAVGEEVVDMGECVALAKGIPDFTGNLVEKGGDPNFFFFLHIPRVAGRTFNFCFTRMVFPPRDRCFSGYDGFTSLGPLSELGYQCKFQGTHDDLSVIEQLPEGTAVFTQIRDPIDRLLSSYEFSLEVAARYVTRKRDPSSDKTKTDDVWPWSDLVPYMMEDIQKRIDAEDMREVDPKVWVKQVDVEGEEVYYNAARKKTMKAEQRKHLDTITPGGALVLDDMDPYDNDMVMPLREYVKLPIVHDLVFNGETFQVLGMTNISSHWELARDIRKCARANEHDNDQYLEFTEILLSKSKAILDKLWHVGMMSDLDASISSLSATSGWNLYGRGYNYSEELSKQMRSFVDNLEGTAKEREFFVSLDIDRVKRDLMEKEAKLTELQYEPDKQDEARMLKEVIAALSKKREDLEAEEIALKNAMTDPEAMLEWKKDAASIYFADDFGREPAGMRIIDSHLGCTTGASKRNAKMKMKTMMKFQDRYGRQLSFSKEKRAELPQDILDYVASHNKIDSELVEIANAIYTDVKTKQMEEGVLQSLNPEGAPPRPRPAGMPPPGLETQPPGSPSAGVPGVGAAGGLPPPPPPGWEPPPGRQPPPGFPSGWKPPAGFGGAGAPGGLPPPPPPGWEPPPPPPGWEPPPGWQPPPGFPPPPGWDPPPGWQPPAGFGGVPGQEAAPEFPPPPPGWKAPEGFNPPGFSGGSPSGDKTEL